jgi:hypothetical protein
MTTSSTASPCDSPCADALEMLAHGHEQTRALADECRRVARHVSGDAGMQEVAEALCRAIHRMAALEEELFFPAARAVLEASALVDLAELEHVERHARHEQAQLFPRLRESCLDMGALGQQLNERLSEHDDRAFVTAAAH